MEHEMKKKHQGFVFIVIFFISFTGMACYSIYYSDNLSDSVHLSIPAPLPDLKLPNEKIIAYIEYLKQHLTDLYVAKKHSDIVDLKLFDWIPHDEKPDERIKTKKIENGFSYTVSLAFYSATHSFCIVDNRLYPEKAVLPDGGKIEKIEDNRVLILKNNKKKWLYP